MNAPSEEEVEAEAMRTLAELDAAKNYEEKDKPPVRQYAQPQPPQPRGYEYQHDSRQTSDAGRLLWETITPGIPPPQAAPVIKTAKIEDLCANHPKLGDESRTVFLRVERKEPKRYANRLIEGFLDDLYRPLTTQEFVNTFGGGKYRVSVMQHGTDGMTRTVALIENLALAGDPIVTEDTMMRQAGPSAPTYMPTEATEIALERLKIDRDREKDLIRSNGQPTEYIKTLTEHIDRANERDAQRADITIKMHRDQVDHLGILNRELRDKADALNARIVSLEKELANVRHSTETETIKRMRDQFDSDTLKAKEEHSRLIEKLMTDSRNSLEQENRRHADERQRILDDSIRDRQRASEDAARREKQLQDDAARQQQYQRENYEGRIHDTESRTKSQIDELKESHRREMDSIRREAESNVAVNTRLSDHTVNSTRNELNDLRAKAERLEIENETLRRASIKDPVAYLSEVKNVAETLLDMKKVSEIEATPSGEEFDWKKEASNVLKGIVEKAPEILQQVQQTRAQQQAIGQQQAAMRQAIPAQRMRSLPSGQAQQPGPQAAVEAPQQRRRTPMAPPPSWARPSGPPAPGAPPVPTPWVQNPVGFEPPHSEAPVTSSASPMEASAPVARNATPVGGSPIQPDVPGLDKAFPPATPPEQDAAEQYNNFISNLDGAINGGVISPKMFAAGAIDQIGAAGVSELMSKITPEHIFTAVSSAGGGGSSIMTRDGQKYVREVWSNAAEMVKNLK